MRLFLYVSLLTVIAFPALAQTATPALEPLPAPTALPAANIKSMPPANDLATLPPMEAKALDDGEPIRLSSDGPTVVRLDRDAATVIVGNPANANVMLENPRMIMLMPGAPGATKIIALDRDGRSILNRHVLVGSGRDGFMHISRVCALGTKDCKNESVYYCPDKCYETTASTETNTGAAPAPVENSGGGGSEADHIQQGPAADADDVGMAVDVVAVDLGMDFGNVKIRVFCAFAAFKNDGAATRRSCLAWAAK